MAPPVAEGKPKVPRVPSSASIRDGGEYTLELRRKSAIASRAARRSSGVKSITSSSVNPCRSKGAGRVGKGCVGEYHSPGTSPAGTGSSSIGQIGSPVTLSKVYTQACLVTCMRTLRPLGKSARIGADGMSQSQMSWWVNW